MRWRSQIFGTNFCVKGILKGLDPLGSPQEADPRSPKGDPQPPKVIPHHLRFDPEIRLFILISSIQVDRLKGIQAEVGVPAARAR
jgi:hypothetical protein